MSIIGKIILTLGALLAYTLITIFLRKDASFAWAVTIFIGITASPYAYRGQLMTREFMYQILILSISGIVGFAILQFLYRNL